jgi:hypothetical protein
MMQTRGRTLALILALVALGAVIHATALSGFWLYDDPVLLVESIRQPAGAIFTDPAEYMHLSATTFTPFLLLSYKFDLMLHGFDTRVFYAHQVAMILAAAVLLFLLLRRYVADWYAAAGAAVFLTTWSTVYGARTLMIRHYVEGLVFALGALLAWRRSKLVASFFYLLAILSKEVYAPIPLFFICESRFQSRSWREIARELIAPAIAAILFLAWRWRMTGVFLSIARGIVSPPDLRALPDNLWHHLIGPTAEPWVAFVWAAAILIVLGAFVWRLRWRAIAFLVISAIVLLLPILPLTGALEWRYSFAFVAFSVAILTIAAGLSARRWTLAVLAILLVTTVYSAFDDRRFYENLTRDGIAREGQYIWSQPAAAPPLGASSPEWYIDSLRWLRAYDHRGKAPRAVFSPYALAVGGVNKIVVVDAAAKQVFAAPPAGRFDPSLPLTVEFAMRDQNAQWQLGPPADRFVFLTDPGYSPTPIPANGVQRVPVAREQQFFRIVREQSDGRWTVSPTLPVPAEGAVTVWRRSL